MSDFVIGGLMARDFGNALVNGACTTAVFFAGIAIAAAVADIAKKILISVDHRGTNSIRPAVCYVFGFFVGLAGSGYLGTRLPFVTFAGGKALKFLALSFGTAAAGTLLGKAGAAVGLITIGGALGYCEPIVPIIAAGAAGSILGSLAVISSIPL